MTDSAPPLTVAAWLRHDAIRRALDEARPRSVLEIGAGLGALSFRLASKYDYVGLEPDPTSYATAEARVGSRGLLHRGDLSSLPEDQTFDLICAFEVLEHIADDAGALKEWRDRLNPGGHVLLSVPAHMKRYGPWDELVGHERRYDRDALVAVVQEAGLAMRQLDAWGAGLGHVLEAGRHRIARRRAAAESVGERTASSGRQLQPNSSVAGLATWALAAPFRLLQRPLAGTSFGIGWVALARRP